MATIVLLPVGFSGVVELVSTPEIYWLMLAVAFTSTVVPFGALRGVALMLIIGAAIGVTASAARLSVEVVEQRRARKLDDYGTDTAP